MLENQVSETWCEKNRRPFGEVTMTFEIDTHVIYTHISHFILDNVTDEWTPLICFFFLCVHREDGGEAAGEGRQHRGGG
jgi:hypothetical protein